MYLLVGAISLVGALLAPPAGPPAADTLRVTVVVDDTVARRHLLRGISLGADEAAHTGALFGIGVSVSVITAGASGDTLRSPLGSVSVVIAAGDSASCTAAARFARSAQAPLIDAGCPPSITDAHAMYSLVSGTVPVARDSAADSTRVELWSGTLERFGGEQLNERFHRRFAARMDSPAWTGWVAVKVALELSMRAHGTNGPLLARQLADQRFQFDGQKGRPLHFDPVTRRLIQPRYRVTGAGDTERVVAEVAP